MKHKDKIIRVTTVPQSLRGLLKGQLRHMNQFYEVLGISSPGQALSDVSKNENIRTISVSMERNISIIKDILALFTLYNIFRNEKPLIVHTHTPKAGTLGMIAAKLAGIPHRLHTVAGMPLLETKGKKRKVLNLVERATYACATKVYPNSKGLYDIILENKFTTKSKLKVIGEGSSNGIDTSFYNSDVLPDSVTAKLKDTLGIKEHDFIFIFVGRLVKDKGINELIRAFLLLNKEHPDTKLLLVGPFEQALDPLEPQTVRLIENTASIITVGLQADVRPYFAISHVLVFPSYREGFPNVVLQAGSMGLPSIVTNINGCNEIVVANVNGLIIPVKDFEAIYYSMLEIKRNNELRHRMQKCSRNMIKERYEQDILWGRILDEYEKLR